MSGSPDSIAGAVRRGLVWSTMNSLFMRMGNLVVGMALARLLAPDQLGVYAIALTVQAILMTFADLGMSVDLVRAEDPERREPTVATLGLASGALLAALMAAASGPVASAMGAPHASSIMTVLSLTLLIGGAGVVPYARMQRAFQQRRLFACTATDFAVSTTVTIGLVLLGVGPMALAIGRVAAQSCATTLQFLLTRVRPRFALDRKIARSALGLGLPLATANLLSWALLNIDNVVISRVAGVTALGFYVLAFNISNWPINAISQGIRGVSLAGFSHQSRAGDASGGLRRALSLAWAAAVPVGALLAALSHPLIVTLYGHRWSASAAVLAALGFFGGLRVALDLLATFLLAVGAARAVLYVQVAWFVALVPAEVAGTHMNGIVGAAWAHLIVAALVVLPAYGFALWRVRASPRMLLSAMWAPLLAGVPTWWVAHAVASAISSPVLSLLAGGTAGCGTYAALSYRCIVPLIPKRSKAAAPRVDHPQLETVA